MARKISFTALSLLAAACIAVPATASAAPLTRLMAPAQLCPGQDGTGQPVAVQERAMRCMTSFARTRLGLRPLGTPAELVTAAVGKAGDILACDDFSHQACGRDFTYWMERSGYLAGGCWRAGENIAWGTGRLGSVGSIFDAWMRSPGHRANILGRYSQIGIGLQVGSLGGYSGAAVWVQQFGFHC
jgi:uncharacterized protein YkwD